MIFAKLKCWVRGHDYRIHQEFTPSSRRIVCDCCHADWAMSDDARLTVPWSSTFKKFYEGCGIAIKPVHWTDGGDK